MSIFLYTSKSDEVVNTLDVAATDDALDVSFCVTSRETFEIGGIHHEKQASITIPVSEIPNLIRQLRKVKNEHKIINPYVAIDRRNYLGLRDLYVNQQPR